MQVICWLADELPASLKAFSLNAFVTIFFFCHILDLHRRIFEDSSLEFSFILIF
jgi:hypothetical protein